MRLVMTHDVLILDRALRDENGVLYNDARFGVWPGVEDR